MEVYHPGTNVTFQNEDCLYLDVYTPFQVSLFYNVNDVVTMGYLFHAHTLLQRSGESFIFHMIVLVDVCGSDIDNH